MNVLAKAKHNTRETTGWICRVWWYVKVQVEFFGEKGGAEAIVFDGNGEIQKVCCVRSFAYDPFKSVEVI